MADITASSPNPADVQTALNQAGPDGRVRIPAGRGLYTSGSAITPPANCRIEGAGVGATVLEVLDCFNVFRHVKYMSGFTAELHNTNELFNGASRDVVMTDFEIINKTLDPHCVAARFVQQNDQFGHPSGVIRKFRIVNARLMGNGAGFGDASAGFGHRYWQEPSKIGKQDSVMVYEDGEIRFDNPGPFSCIDSNNGFAFVARKMKFWNTTVECHDVQGDHRATRSWEVYDCEFDSSGEIPFANYMRGGTGVVHGNILGKFYSVLLAFSNQRSWNKEFLTRAPMFACNGSSAWDGNEPDQKGWPARDQIGRGRDLGAFPSKQESEPVYVWGNKKRLADGSLVDFNEVVVWNTGADIKPGGSSADIKPNREYFLSARPGYTPLVYPHPLAGTAPTPPVDPPPVEPPAVDPPPTEPPNAPPVVTIRLQNTASPPVPIDPTKPITVKNVEIYIQVSDDVGPTVSDLYIGGQFVRNFTTYTLTHKWNTAPWKGRTVEIKVVAKDAADGTGTQTLVVNVKK